MINITVAPISWYSNRNPPIHVYQYRIGKACPVQFNTDINVCALTYESHVHVRTCTCVCTSHIAVTLSGRNKERAPGKSPPWSALTLPVTPCRPQYNPLLPCSGRVQLPCQGSSSSKVYSIICAHFVSRRKTILLSFCSPEHFRPNGLLQWYRWRTVKKNYENICIGICICSVIK